MAKKEEATAPAHPADKFAAFIDALVQSQTISADTGATIKAAIEHKRSSLE